MIVSDVLSGVWKSVISIPEVCIWSVHRLLHLVFKENIHRKNVKESLLGAFFLGAYIIQMLPKHIWVCHCYQFYT